MITKEQRQKMLDCIDTHKFCDNIKCENCPLWKGIGTGKCLRTDLIDKVLNIKITQNKWEIIAKLKKDYTASFEEPDTIIINQNTLRMLEEDYQFFRLNAEPLTIFGMKIEIDNTMVNDTFIVYKDKNVYSQGVLKCL